MRSRDVVECDDVDQQTGGQTMSEQQSQKRGIRSEAQKEMRAREGYEPLPPSNAVAGAFGENRRETPTDQDLALSLEERRARRERDDHEQ
jgi:hypothetical protein